MTRKLDAYKRNWRSSYTRAQLAHLRQGIGHTPGEMPELWGALFEEMPEQLMATNGEPTYAEWAVYTALTLYALHQQGREIDTDDMHIANVSIGKALAHLVHTEDDRNRIAQYFKMFINSRNIMEAARNIRHLIELLKSESVGLDYVQLAKDLYSFQFSDKTKKVLLQWGRDFYRGMVIEESEEDDND